MSAGIDKERLRALLDEKSRSARQVSLAAGLGETAVKDILNGKSKNPEFQTLAKIALALGVPLGEFVAGADATANGGDAPHTTGGGEPSQAREAVAAPPVEVRRVPVLGIVQAGAWAEVFDDEPQPLDWVVFDEPAYARTEAFALIVRGPSVDLFYPDGSRVICIPATSTGIQDGDFVVVRRRRGAFAETTLKQIQLGKDGDIELWPRSSDPAFQEPIRLSETRDPEESPEVLAVVVARYDVGRAGRGPLIQFK
jgi:transcriptional regulator with XRE-family HTH domain